MNGSSKCTFLFNNYVGFFVARPPNLLAPVITLDLFFDTLFVLWQDFGFEILGEFVIEGTKRHFLDQIISECGNILRDLRDLGFVLLRIHGATLLV